MRYRDLSEVPRRTEGRRTRAQLGSCPMGRSAARPQRFPGMDGAEAEDRPATMPLRLVGPAALSDYRIGDSGHPTCCDRQAVPGLDARRGCGAAAQAQSRPRRGCGPAKARGATYPRGAVVTCHAVWGPFNGRAPIFLPEFRSRRSCRADRKSGWVQCGRHSICHAG